MKKKMNFSMAMLCAIGLFSCSKNIAHSENDTLNESVFETASVNLRVSNSNFFDPTGLISKSQHGVLDTVQKGFRFR